MSTWKMFQILVLYSGTNIIVRFDLLRRRMGLLLLFDFLYFCTSCLIEASIYNLVSKDNNLFSPLPADSFLFLSGIVASETNLKSLLKTLAIIDETLKCSFESLHTWQTF